MRYGAILTAVALVLMVACKSTTPPASSNQPPPVQYEQGPQSPSVGPRAPFTPGVPVAPIQHNPFTITTNDPAVTVPVQQPVSITTTNQIALIANGLLSTTNTINGRINVRSFDVTIGTGGDDWSKLQSAVNNLPPRKTLYLPAGEYFLSQTLVLSNNVSIEGDGVSQEYQFALFGTNAPFYGTLSQTVLQPLGGPQNNFTLIRVTNVTSTSPAILLKNIVLYGGDGVCAFPGPSTNTTGYGGTNFDFTVTFTTTNSTGLDFTVGGFGLMAQNCVSIGWSGAGFKLGGGSRLINSYASLCGVCCESLGTDTYIINPLYHHAKNGIFLGSRTNLGDVADVYANWNHIVGGRIEWMEQFGTYFKAGEQLVNVETEYDRTGYANLATDNPFTRYNLIIGEFKRGGCFYRGIAPGNVPLSDRIKACSLYLKNCGESYFSGVSRVLNSQDNGTGVLVPSLGAVLDNARDSHFIMSGTFDEVNQVSVTITNSQNNLTISQPGKLDIYDVNGVRSIYDNGIDSLVLQHFFAAPYVASTGTNDPQLLVVDSGTNLNGTLRYTEKGTNSFWDMRKAANGHYQILDDSTAHTDLDLSSDLWIMRKDIIIDNFSAGQTTTLNLNDNGVTKWAVGKAGDNSFFIYDNAAGNNLMSVATGGDLAISRNVRAAFVHPNNMSVSALAMTDGSGNLVSLANQTNTVLVNQGANPYWFAGKTTNIDVISPGPVTNQWQFVAGVLSNIVSVP